MQGRTTLSARRMRRFFTELFGEFAASQRAGRVAGPYRTPANPYCPAKFDCKVDLPQQFKRSDSQIRLFRNRRRVPKRPQGDYVCSQRPKNSASLNRTRSTHQIVTQRPFSPPSFPARRKRWGRRRRVGNALLVCGLGLPSTDT